jgi:hypothetical protein
MSVTYKFPAESEFAKGQAVIMMKGAVEGILDSSSQFQLENEVKTIDEGKNF